MPDPDSVQRHRLYEDVLAILLGTLMVALGVTFYAKAVLLTGSIMGLSLLIQYTTGLGVAVSYVVLSLPFCWLGFARLGWKPMLRTFLAVLLLALFARLTPGWVVVDRLDPVYASMIGGGLMGVGTLILFRHRTGLGGINILALYLQERYGISAGRFQLGVDAAVMLAACFVLDLGQVGLSMAGAGVLNLVLAMNHRPGRYVAVS